MEGLKLEFTLTPGCPMMCSYCPQDQYIQAYKNNPDKFLSLQSFEIMMENISKFRRDISFTGFTEPLVNPYWFEMATSAKKKGHNIYVSTTLYNASPQDILNLVSLDCPFEIHLTDSSQFVPIENYLLLLRSTKKSFGLKFYTQVGKDIAKEIHSKIQLKPSLYTKPIYCNGNAHSRAGNVSGIEVETIHDGPVICDRTHGQYEM